MVQTDLDEFTAELGEAPAGSFETAVDMEEGEGLDGNMAAPDQYHPLSPPKGDQQPLFDEHYYDDLVSITISNVEAKQNAVYQTLKIYDSHIKFKDEQATLAQGQIEQLLTDPVWALMAIPPEFMALKSRVENYFSLKDENLSFRAQQIEILAGTTHKLFEAIVKLKEADEVKTEKARQMEASFKKREADLKALQVILNTRSEVALMQVDGLHEEFTSVIERIELKHKQELNKTAKDAQRNVRLIQDMREDGIARLRGTINKLNSLDSDDYNAVKTIRNELQKYQAFLEAAAPALPDVSDLAPLTPIGLELDIKAPGAKAELTKETEVTEPTAPIESDEDDSEVPAIIEQQELQALQQKPKLIPQEFVPIIRLMKDFTKDRAQPPKATNALLHAYVWLVYDTHRRMLATGTAFNEANKVEQKFTTNYMVLEDLKNLGLLDYKKPRGKAASWRLNSALGVKFNPSVTLITNHGIDKVMVGYKTLEEELNEPELREVLGEDVG